MHYMMLAEFSVWIVCFSYRYTGTQRWISDMEIDGPTSVPESGYFLLIWVQVCLKKLDFSYFLSQFYELVF